MKKIQKRWYIFVTCILLISSCLVLSGCGRKNYNKDFDKAFSQIKRVYEQVGVEDLQHCFEVVANSSVYYAGFAYDSGEFYCKTTDDLEADKEVVECIKTFFERYPNITSLRCEGSMDGITMELGIFDNSDMNIVITDMDEPDNPSWKYGREFAKAYKEDEIVWVADYRSDKSDSNKGMYYEARMKQVAKRVWLSYEITIYPWYSRLIG